MKHNLYFYYHIGFVCLTGLFVFEFLLFYFVEIPVVTMQLTAVVLGATFTAYLTSRTYDYISKSTQEREWRRNVQMKMWEDIYLPIYEDATGYLSAIESFGYPHASNFRQWHDFDLSHEATILEIINPSYLKELQKHIRIFNHYIRARKEFELALEDSARSYHSNLFPQAEKVEIANLTGKLTHNDLYFIGVAHNIPRDRLENYKRKYNSVKSSHPSVAEDPISTITNIRSNVQFRVETRKHYSMQQELVASTKKLIEATREVIQKPYQI
ncbi:MAG: hypothetical protein KAW09_09965 [Thermoplasmata archaeon]|nr:hypothetical protein [Thermoplasmata archaeon]